MRSLLPLCVVLALPACSPNNAEVSGNYTMFMANRSSRTLFDGSIKVADAENHYNIDCRVLNDESERLDDPIDICERTAGWPPTHEGWIRNDAYQVVQEEIVPWRGEAVMTSEGDLQITFHHAPPGVDMRIAFVVDPNFEPRRCVETDGELQWEPIDGADWLEQWSDGYDGQMFLLNAASFQFNPSNPEEEIWFLPEEWAAGYARARFGPEEMFVRKTRFGRPAAYLAFEETDVSELTENDLFYVGEIDAGEDPAGNSFYQAEIDRVTGISETITEELTMLQVPAMDYFADGRTSGDYSTIVQTNEWRTPDGSSSGLDRWIELHYSWVRFDAGSDLTVGGDATGEFALVFDGAESQSVLVVAGEFAVDRIKRDRWVTGDVQADKLEEYGTTICNEAASAE